MNGEWVCVCKSNWHYMTHCQLIFCPIPLSLLSRNFSRLYTLQLCVGVVLNMLSPASYFPVNLNHSKHTHIYWENGIFLCVHTKTLLVIPNFSEDKNKSGENTHTQHIHNFYLIDSHQFLSVFWHCNKETRHVHLWSLLITQESAIFHRICHSYVTFPHIAKCMMLSEPWICASSLFRETCDVMSSYRWQDST
jgi:hypothetical protein